MEAYRTPENAYVMESLTEDGDIERAFVYTETGGWFVYDVAGGWRKLPHPPMKYEEFRSLVKDRKFYFDDSIVTPSEIVNSYIRFKRAFIEGREIPFIPVTAHGRMPGIQYDYTTPPLTKDITPLPDSVNKPYHDVYQKREVEGYYVVATPRFIENENAREKTAITLFNVYTKNGDLIGRYLHERIPNNDATAQETGQLYKRHAWFVYDEKKKKWAQVVFPDAVYAGKETGGKNIAAQYASLAFFHNAIERKAFFSTQGGQEIHMYAGKRELVTHMEHAFHQEIKTPKKGYLPAYLRSSFTPEHSESKQLTARLSLSDLPPHSDLVSGKAHVIATPFIHTDPFIADEVRGILYHFFNRNGAHAFSVVDIPGERIIATTRVNKKTDEIEWVPFDKDQYDEIRTMLRDDIRMLQDARLFYGKIGDKDPVVLSALADEEESFKAYLTGDETGTRLSQAYIQGDYIERVEQFFRNIGYQIKRSYFTPGAFRGLQGVQQMPRFVYDLVYRESSRGQRPTTQFRVGSRTIEMFDFHESSGFRIVGSRDTYVSSAWSPLQFFVGTPRTQSIRILENLDVFYAHSPEMRVLLGKHFEKFFGADKEKFIAVHFQIDGPVVAPAVSLFSRRETSLGRVYDIDTYVLREEGFVHYRYDDNQYGMGDRVDIVPHHSVRRMFETLKQQIGEKEPTVFAFGNIERSMTRPIIFYLGDDAAQKGFKTAHFAMPTGEAYVIRWEPGNVDATFEIKPLVSSDVTSLHRRAESLIPYIDRGMLFRSLEDSMRNASQNRYMIHNKEVFFKESGEAVRSREEGERLLREQVEHEYYHGGTVDIFDTLINSDLSYAVNVVDVDLIPRPKAHDDAGIYTTPEMFMYAVVKTGRRPNREWMEDYFDQLSSLSDSVASLKGDITFWRGDNEQWDLLRVGKDPERAVVFLRRGGPSKNVLDRGEIYIFADWSPLYVFDVQQRKIVLAKDVVGDYSYLMHYLGMKSGVQDTGDMLYRVNHFLLQKGWLTPATTYFGPGGVPVKTFMARPSRHAIENSVERATFPEDDILGSEGKLSMFDYKSFSQREQEFLTREEGIGFAVEQVPIRMPNAATLPTQYRGVLNEPDGKFATFLTPDGSTVKFARTENGVVVRLEGENDVVLSFEEGERWFTIYSRLSSIRAIEQIPERALPGHFGPAHPRRRRYRVKSNPFEDPTSDDLKAARRILSQTGVNLPDGGKISPLSGLYRMLTSGKKLEDMTPWMKERYRTRISDRLRYLFVDDMQYFRKATDMLIKAYEEKMNAPVRISNNPDYLATLHRGYPAKIAAVLEYGIPHPNRTDTMLTDYGFGHIFDTLFDGVPASHLDEITNEFAAYLIARRTVERKAQSGIAGKDATLEEDIAEGQRILDELKETDPEKLKRFERTAELWNKWAHSLLDYWVERGRISVEERNKIIARNPTYVPFTRVLDDFLGESEIYQTYLKAAQPVQKLKGSTLRFQDVYEEMVMKTMAMIHEADRNHAVDAFARMLEESPELGIGGPGKLGPYTFGVYRGGERIPFHVTDGYIHYALKTLGQTEPDTLIVFSALSRLARNIVVKSPSFALRNFVNDNLQRVVYTEGVLYPSRLDRKEAAKLLAYAGGSQAGYGAEYTEDFRKVVQRMIRDELAKRGASVTAVLNPNRLVDGYNEALAALENVSRVEEFRAVYERYANTKDITELERRMLSALAARDLIDFAVAGRTIRTINRFIPFTNAAAQSFRKMVREGAKAAKDPRRAASIMMRFGLLIGLPELLVTWYNYMDPERRKAYKKLPEYRKDLFWNIPLDTGKHQFWISIPKGHEMSILASGFRRLFEREMTPKFLQSLENRVSPFHEGLFTGPYIKYMEPFINYDFLNKTSIVSPYELSKPMHLRSKRDIKRTSSAARFIGYGMNTDPRLVEKAIYTWFGDWGKLVSDVTRMGPDTIKFARTQPRDFLKYTGMFYAPKRAAKMPDFLERYMEGLDNPGFTRDIKP